MAVSFLLRGRKRGALSYYARDVRRLADKYTFLSVEFVEECKKNQFFTPLPTVTIL